MREKSLRLCVHFAIATALLHSTAAVGEEFEKVRSNPACAELFVEDHEPLWLGSDGDSRVCDSDNKTPCTAGEVCSKFIDLSFQFCNPLLPDCAEALGVEPSDDYEGYEDYETTPDPDDSYEDYYSSPPPPPPPPTTTTTKKPTTRRKTTTKASTTPRSTTTTRRTTTTAKRTTSATTKVAPTTVSPRGVADTSLGRVAGTVTGPTVTLAASTQPGGTRQPWLHVGGGEAHLFPSPGNICADHHRRCHEWTARGECVTNPLYMRAQCHRSCGCCGNRCLSKINFACANAAGVECIVWKEAGHCTSNSAWMHANCAGACNVCPAANARTTTGPTANAQALNGVLAQLIGLLQRRGSSGWRQFRLLQVSAQPTGHLSARSSLRARHLHKRLLRLARARRIQRAS